MPKAEIDYSNTIIYKITCKDPSNTDVYIGHTINFVQRKHAHKQSCNNKKSPNHDCKLYKVIRENGGWENWTMDIVNFFNCQGHYEAREKEQEYFTLLNATLNSIEPIPKLKEKYIVTEYNPIQTPSYKNSKKIFYCENCDYKCCNKFDFNKHLGTRKHLTGNNTKEKSQKITKIYICGTCNNEYKHQSSLCKHVKTCQHFSHSPQDDNQVGISSLDINLITKLLKQNEDFKNLMVDQKNKMIETFQEACKNYINNLNMPQV